MSAFNFNPPKEFGDRSDVGLGGLRALHQMQELNYAKSDTGDTVAIKGNGFDTVTRKPPPPGAPGRWISDGRFAGDTGSSLVFAGNLRAPFKKKPLSVVGGDGGSLTLGIERTLISAATDVSGNINVYRTKDFDTKFLELTTNCTVPTSSRFYVVNEQAAHMKDGAGNIIEYETMTFSRMDGQNVLPKVAYSVKGVWSFAAIGGYDQYDHYTFSSAQLAPDVHMICHAVVRRGDIFTKGARSDTPIGTVPYPLFQVSRDGGRTYNAVNLDFLFAGSTYQYASPPVAGTVGTPGLGGYDVITTIAWLALPNFLFVSLLPEIDSPSAISISIGGFNVEPRIFRSNGFDLTSMTSIPPPPGFGTVWDGSLIPAFANAQPGSNYGMIGYFAYAVDPTQPNMLFVSLDAGNTWQPPRLLPGISRYCDFVQDITTRELTCSVYEEVLAVGLSGEFSGTRVVRYASTDFGVTWSRRQTIAEHCIALGPTDYLQDFYYILPVTPDDGSLPAATPMSGWRFDSRLPRLTHV